MKSELAQLKAHHGRTPCWVIPACRAPRSSASGSWPECPPLTAVWRVPRPADLPLTWPCSLVSKTDKTLDGVTGQSTPGWRQSTHSSICSPVHSTWPDAAWGSPDGEGWGQVDMDPSCTGRPSHGWEAQEGHLDHWEILPAMGELLCPGAEGQGGARRGVSRAGGGAGGSRARGLGWKTSGRE